MQGAVVLFCFSDCAGKVWARVKRKEDEDYRRKVWLSKASQHFPSNHISSLERGFSIGLYHPRKFVTTV